MATTRNIGKKSNQSSLTERALPNALNFTDWRLSQGAWAPSGPYGHDGTDSDDFRIFQNISQKDSPKNSQR